MTPEQLEPWSGTTMLGKLEGGYRNEVYLVEHDGVRHVAKTTRRSEAAVLWLNEVLDAAEAAGFVVPRFVNSDDGRVMVNGVTLETFIAGEQVAKQAFPLLMAPLKKFHALTTRLPQRPTFAASTELLKKTRGGDVDLEVMPAHLVRRCRAAWRVLGDWPQTVVHGDLNPANILRTAGGRFALLDWDEARVDAAVFDLAVFKPRLEKEIKCALFTWELAVCWTIEPEHARHVLQKLEALD